MRSRRPVLRRIVRRYIPIEAGCNHRWTTIGATPYSLTAGLPPLDAFCPISTVRYHFACGEIGLLSRCLCIISHSLAACPRTSKVQTERILRGGKKVESKYNTTRIRRAEKPLIPLLAAALMPRRAGRHWWKMKHVAGGGTLRSRSFSSPRRLQVQHFCTAARNPLMPVLDKLPGRQPEIMRSISPLYHVRPPSQARYTRYDTAPSSG